MYIKESKVRKEHSSPRSYIVALGCVNLVQGIGTVIGPRATTRSFAFGIIATGSGQREQRETGKQESCRRTEHVYGFELSVFNQKRKRPLLCVFYLDDRAGSYCIIGNPSWQVNSPKEGNIEGINSPLGLQAPGFHTVH
jgi:hypothetical protein